PWQLVKDESKGRELGGSLYAGIEAVRLAGYLLYPYTPNISAKICALLGVPAPDVARWQDVAKWGVLKPGDPIKTGPALFPRLEKVTA
ncbi:MAG TPA: methionine--tRNA ligase, partial [Methylomirabilota bacterium]|nr:methionine--tRNA ligase [Methylomirabilota bacterium]